MELVFISSPDLTQGLDTLEGGPKVIDRDTTAVAQGRRGSCFNTTDFFHDDIAQRSGEKLLSLQIVQKKFLTSMT